MKTHTYTLLIVESSTIASWIRTLQLPWLEVLATEGYLWHPVYNPEKEKLYGKADPSGRKKRKQIKQLSNWASKVIIAVDTDPSGDFIAWSLSRHLNIPNLYRTTLHHLSSQSILEQINCSSLIESDNLLDKLELRYLFNYLWKKKWGYLKPVDTALQVLVDLPESYYYRDKEYRLYKGSVTNTEETPLDCSVYPDKTDYFLFSPPSTYDILQEMSAYFNNNTHEENSEKLFRLFTLKTGMDPLHLISYPRTASNGYYPATWQRIESISEMKRWRHSLKPQNVREVISTHKPHESLRPVDMAEAPSHLNRIIDEEYRTIYRIVYKSFYQSTVIHKVPLFHPEKPYPISFYLFDQIKKNINSPIRLQRCHTIGSLGTKLDALGVTRPSTYGKQLDKWIKQDKLQIKGRFLLKGSKWEKPDNKIRQAYSMLKSSYSIVQNGSSEELKEYWNRF